MIKNLRCWIGVFLWTALHSLPAFANDNPAPEDWTLHEQFTTVLQAHPPFHAPYTGPVSLSAVSEGRTSVTSTLFLGRRLWHGASFYVNPEVVGGSGFSHTQGIAGFPNGEIFRVDSPTPKITLARLYFQQIVGFRTGYEERPSDENQLAGIVPVNRLTFVGGEFSLTDFFDNNAYSHDPRTQFLNWALFANGAWDYPANTRGYTTGLYAEYNRAAWAVRAATVMEPRQANQLILDPKMSEAHGDTLEFEWRYHIQGHPGKLRPLAYWNHAHMGNYRDTINNPAFGLDITRSRTYSQKYGFGLNMEQEILNNLGFFARAGWSDGKTETWAFTEIDQTLSAGFNYKGSAWHRPDDRVGLACVVNGLSQDHRDYLRAGGVGFLIGDGQLNYAPEQIIETFYSLSLYKHLTLTPDIQLVKNPAYNADRGPVAIGAIRVHLEY